MAQDTDDWQAASRWLDEGIGLLAGQADPPLIPGMSHCLRGECDVFAGDVPSAVARTQSGLATAARYPDSWGLGFSPWNADIAEQAAGELDAALFQLRQMIELRVKAGYEIPAMVGANKMAEILEAREELDASRALWGRAQQLRRDLPAASEPKASTGLRASNPGKL